MKALSRPRPLRGPGSASCLTVQAARQRRKSAAKSDAVGRSMPSALAGFVTSSSFHSSSINLSALTLAFSSLRSPPQHDGSRTSGHEHNLFEDHLPHVHISERKEAAMIEASYQKRYGGTRRSTRFLRRPARTGTGFLGPNGAGKSTTMRMVLGLDAPSSGTVLVNGVPYGELSDPLRSVGALLDAKAVVGLAALPTISGGSPTATTSSGAGWTRSSTSSGLQRRADKASRHVLARHESAARHRCGAPRRP